MYVPLESDFQLQCGLLFSLYIHSLALTKSSLGILPPTYNCKNNCCQNKETYGRDYQGTAAWSKSGKACLKWSGEKPYKHGYTNVGDHNFCRNPDNHEKGVWCYITDKEKRWEECDVPKCDFGKKFVEKYNCLFICLM